MTTESRDARLKQIRERWTQASLPEQVFTSHCKQDIDFLLFLLDSQVQTARELALIVDVGTSDDPGTAITKIRRLERDAATRMRDACVETVKELQRQWGKEGETPVAAQRAAREIVDMDINGRCDPRDPNSLQAIAAIITRYLVGTPDPCAAAGRHVCGPMDREAAEAVKNGDDQ